MNTAQRPSLTFTQRIAALHLDLPLLLVICIACLFGLGVLYSASGQSVSVVGHQSARLGLGLVAMVFVAQIPPRWLRIIAPWGLLGGIALILAVVWLGEASMGARRWLDLGVFRFQPSEIVKLMVPLALASFLHTRVLPPRWLDIVLCVFVIGVPAAVVAIEPDLGSAVLIVASGACVLFFAGIRWRLIMTVVGLVAAAAPIIWFFFLHGYQQERILTFLNPSSEPLDAGYHILQSKIAIGSGGLFGQGWLDGSQARLSFLPEAQTDFIFAVYAEETGFFGVAGLLLIYACIVGRGLVIALGNPETFERLAAASISVVFFLYAFINIAMVSGILPVVGVPLPLISYGGTSLVALLTSFGVLMSIQTHRELLSQ
ncbi:rod shape-determining protein RodA [Salinisphaera orenii]|uniref:rod shape-determining protein RodA n=1 Tax=Salinisphaera orenii TaxID=856731 RepID=UPI0019550B15